MGSADVMVAILALFMMLLVWWIADLQSKVRSLKDGLRNTLATAIGAHEKLDEAKVAMSELIEELRKKGPDIFPEGEYHAEVDLASEVGLDPDSTLVLGDPRNLRRARGQDNHR